MNAALQIISIQYELVLSLGNTLELEEMLQKFLRVCNARLSLSGAHIFLYADADANPCSSTHSNAKHLQHFVSLPDKCDGRLCSESDRLYKKAKEFYLDSAEEGNKEDSIKCFIIEDFGVLVLESSNPIDLQIEALFEPILKKLALSCSASINHYSLIREVEARVNAEKEVHYQAYHDEVTGIANRRSMRESTEKAIDDSVVNNTSGALLFVDLNDFKSVNDLMGHHVGDKLLKEVASLLLKTIPTAEKIARFGGDEFTVLLRELAKDKAMAVQQVQVIVDAIIDAVDEGFDVDNSHYSVGCTIGYDIFNNDSPLTATELVRNADLAMYEAKRSDATHGLCYQESMSEALDRKIAYVTDIKQALKNDDFELHYQPQYNDTQNIIGAEALLRWNHPERGYESPAVYIPIAEESDLIVSIGDWVLDRACRDIAAIEQLDIPSDFKSVSINVSAKQLAKDDFVEKVLSTIKRYKIFSHHLSIEITEGIMVGDIEKSIDVLQQLRRNGIQCSIDDFGTGYSSLTYLKRLPASLIKIDRSFVIDINEDRGNQSIANMIIDLADNLDMDVIAEGVETELELSCLGELGCKQYQGYFFCKPVPFDMFTQYLSNTQCQAG